MSGANGGPADVRVEIHGTIVLLNLASKAASRWVAENVNTEAQFWCGALVVEPRYVADIVAGMRAAGLVVV